MKDEAKPKLKRGGKRPGAGRKKGATNLVPREVKEMIVNTLHNAGGEEYLLNIAKNDPKTFCGLIGRVIPLQHANDPDNPFEFNQDIIIRLTGPNGADD